MQLCLFTHTYQGGQINCLTLAFMSPFSLVGDYVGIFGVIQTFEAFARAQFLIDGSLKCHRHHYAPPWCK